MTVFALRDEIKKMVDVANKDVLQDVFSQLKNAQNQQIENDKLDMFFNKVVDENRGLLQKLAK